MNDLNNGLHCYCITNKNAKPEDSQRENAQPEFILGEHIIAFLPGTDNVNPRTCNLRRGRGVIFFSYTKKWRGAPK